MFSGIILILGSQIVSASQMVIEEAFLKKRNLHPLHVSLWWFILSSIETSVSHQAISGKSF